MPKDHPFTPKFKLIVDHLKAVSTLTESLRVWAEN